MFMHPFQRQCFCSSPGRTCQQQVSVLDKTVILQVMCQEKLCTVGAMVFFHISDKRVKSS